MQTEEVKEKYNLDKIIKLASNENPYGYSAKVKTIFTEMENEFYIYPDGYTTELRTAIAHILNVSKEQIIFGGGSDEIIQMISRDRKSVVKGKSNNRGESGRASSKERVTMTRRDVTIRGRREQ